MLLDHPQIGPLVMEFLAPSKQLQLLGVASSVRSTTLHFIEETVIEGVAQSAGPFGSQLDRHLSPVHLNYIRQCLDPDSCRLLVNELRRATDDVVDASSHAEALERRVRRYERKSWKRSVPVESGVEDLDAFRIFFCPTLPAETFFIADNCAVLGTDSSTYKLPRHPLRELSAVASFRSVVDITLTACRGLTHFRSGVLCALKCLRSIQLNGLHDLVAIEDNFLSSCPSLRVVSLSCCPSLDRIGNSFCAHTELEYLDVSSWTNVSRIGDEFLSMSRVRSLDCRSWSNVARIGRAFCRGTSLHTFDATSWKMMSSIGAEFLASASILTADLSGWSRMKKIPDGFLAGSTVQQLRAEGWTSVKSIGARFCSKTRLQILDASSWVALEVVGRHFLADTPSLQQVMCPWRSVTTIGDDFLNKAALSGFPTAIDAQDWESVSEIGYGFLQGSGVASLRTNWPRINQIGDDFCSEVHSDVLAVSFQVPNLRSIGKRFLAESSLRNLSLHCTSLASVGPNMLSRCEQLITVDLSCCPSLTSLGTGFCEGSPNVSVKKCSG